MDWKFVETDNSDFLKVIRSFLDIKSSIESL